MAIRDSSNTEGESGHRKMCNVCGKQIDAGSEKWERGEPVHGECKQGWGM